MVALEPAQIFAVVALDMCVEMDDVMPPEKQNPTALKTVELLRPTPQAVWGQGKGVIIKFVARDMCAKALQGAEFANR